MKYSEAEFFYGASPEIFRKAAELRMNMTEAEKLLWDGLKGKQIGGLRFRRQHPISRFIVDFYCHHAKLIVEIDGGIHLNEEVKEYDEGRTYELEQFGLKVIRFKNEEVLKHLDKVINRIKYEIPKVPHLGDLGGKIGNIGGKMIRMILLMS